MPEDNGLDPTLNATWQKVWNSYWGFFDKPSTFIKEKIIHPLQGDKKSPYYHRRYRRLPGVDTCEVGDQICVYEHNKEFRRDRKVDREVLRILRQRMNACRDYYGRDDQSQFCRQAIDEYNDADANFFAKYGDLNVGATVVQAYMKQKHRLIWERRHGEVGTGMRPKEEWGSS